MSRFQYWFLLFFSDIFSIFSHYLHKVGWGFLLLNRSSLPLSMKWKSRPILRKSYFLKTTRQIKLVLSCCATKTNTKTKRTVFFWIHVSTSPGNGPKTKRLFKRVFQISTSFPGVHWGTKIKWYLIFVIFLRISNLWFNLFSTQKCVNRDKTA